MLGVIDTSALGNLVIVANSAARPVGAARYPGVLIYQADVGSYFFWNGSSWIALAVGGGGGGGGSSTFAGDTDVSFVGLADWDIPRYSLAPAKWINDQLSDHPTIAQHSTDITALKSSVASLGTQSTLIRRVGTNTLISNSTAVSSDLNPAAAALPFIGDSGLAYFGKWELINSSGSAQAVNLLLKINGTNSLNPPPFFLGSTGATLSYFLDIAVIITAGSDNTHHSQFMVFQIRPAANKNSNTSVGTTGTTVNSWACGYYVDPSTYDPVNALFGGKALDAHNIVQSTAFDIGTTVPPVEVRANWVTAAASGQSLQRVVSEEYYIADT